MEYYELYVTRIRELCKERGFTINKLAAMSNVKQSTLDNIVRGLTKKSTGKDFAQNCFGIQYDPDGVS